MSRVRCPGSWWRQRNTGRVLYGPQETCPPVPAGGGGIWVGRGDPWGTKTRGQTKVTYLVSSSVTPLWDTGQGDAGIRQNESLESNREHRRHRKQGMTFKNRQTLTEWTRP